MELLMSQSNTTLTDQEGSWIHDVAARLRLIQADTAQLAPEKRSEFLQEEVERNLKNVPPANRKRFIEALHARFPVAGKVVTSFPAPPAPTPAPPPAPVAVAESPEKTLERLLAAIPQLSEEKRGDLARRLFESDLVRAYRSELVLETTEESQRALGLPTGQQPRLERMVQLTVLLLDVFSRLDQTALRTMEALAPRSPLLKRSESIRKAAARFLIGEVETVEPQMREMFSLMGALMVSPSDASRAFGKIYVELFSPGAIDEFVNLEGDDRIIFKPKKKERCWDRYCDLARDLATDELVARKIWECLAAEVHKTVGKSRAGGR